ncbi:MAG: type IV secretory system conjugative DNA transfer family protein [Burkholderiales bacterium]|jgi:hypothetical protein|nr:type IV secretory system conjugative DNA transfer family protein [Burkholderiales bacterium]
MNDYDVDQNGIFMISLKASGLWFCTWSILFLMVPLPFASRFGSILVAGISTIFFLIGINFFTLGIYLLLRGGAARQYAEQQRHWAAQKIEDRKQELMNSQSGAFSGLSLGYSTGLLENRGCPVGVRANEKIHLPPPNCCQNILVLGGIGSGKTASVINPTLLQILRSDASALIFDIKGDFQCEVAAIATFAKRKYQIIGLAGDALTINLFRGCSPEQASGYLRSCFVAKGAASGDSSFWVDSACNYCRNLLYLIELGGGDYNIAGLATVAFSERKRNELIEACLSKAEKTEFSESESGIWDLVFDYFQESVAQWDDKLRSNILATLQTVLNPFVMPDFVKAFSAGNDKEVNFDDLLTAPTIFLVQLPQSMGDGARWAYLLIKLRFFDLMRSRRARSAVNQDRFVAFFCDEYQKIVDSVSDIDFWDKSRSSKCFGVVSMQGYSSLIQSVGSRQAADAIAQNWRQKVLLLSEDQASIEQMQKLIGRGDAQIHSHSESKSVGARGQNGAAQKTSSASHSVSIQRREFFDYSDLRAMARGQALFVGTVGHQAQADVIDVVPLPID